MNWVRMSVFDLDRTLVFGNSSFAFCQYLIARGVLSRTCMGYVALAYVRHVYFGMSLKLLHEKIFERLLRGKSVKLLESHVEPFVEFYLSHHVNPSALACLRLAQHLGEYTLILSNAPQFLVGHFARALNVHEWHSTQYAVDSQDQLVEIESILQGDEKAACVRDAMQRLNIAKKDVTAYSDSYLDLPLLLASGTAVAVNPDRKLKEFSQQQNWALK
ncbi:MAG: HAD-IB family phosphatase [Rhabdochlamydiaceae bacterium]|nr:HAD-IB family phosphatase [Rhabdochlamydiaceae bacterium]